MKVLQLCSKSPQPAIDGGCLAMDSITQGLLAAGHSVKVLSAATQKHPDRRWELPASYVDATAFDTVFVDTTVRPIAAALNLLGSESYNITRFNSDTLRRKLISVLRAETFDIVQLETLPMLNYLADIRGVSTAKIVYRAHNVEHQVWDRLAAGAHGLKAKYLRLLARRLEAYERASLNLSDGVAAITREDASRLKAMGCVRPLVHIPFSLPLGDDSAGAPGNVFFHIGAMDWAPNDEAMRFLTTRIWPRIRQQRPEAKLRLAGRKMPDHFCTGNGILIDGEVPDAKAYMRDNGILLAPLLSGGGMRIKLVEAMALGRAVVSTPIGLEGIAAANGVHAAIAGSAEEFADAAIRLYDDAHLRARIGHAARQLVVENFSRPSVTSKLVAFYHDLRGAQGKTALGIELHAAL